MKEYISDSLRSMTHGTADACSVVAGAMGGSLVSSHAASRVYDALHGVPGAEYVASAVFFAGMTAGEYAVLSAARSVAGVPRQFED